MTIEEIYDKIAGVGAFNDLDFEQRRLILEFGHDCKIEGIKSLGEELRKDKE